MPLFGGNERGNDRARQLVANANGESVTKDRLTNASGGLFADGFLHDQPLIDYLRPGEQPHYILFNRSDGVTRNGVTERNDWRNDYRNVLMLTDARALFFVADNTGDEGEAIPYAIITDVDLRTGGTKPTLSLRTPIAEYVFDIATDAADVHEVMAARRYVEERAETLASAGEDPTVHLHGKIEQVPDLWPGSTRRRRTLLESEEFPEPDAGKESVPPDDLSIPDLADRLAAQTHEDLCDVVEELWEETGWRTRSASGSADHDVEARRESPFLERHLVRVDIDGVDADEVAGFAGAGDHDGGHDVPVVVALGDASPDARERATDVGVKLLDAEQFAALVAEHETFGPLEEA